MDHSFSPAVVVDNLGKKIVNDYRNQKGIVNSHLVAVDSRVRDRTLFPNANSFKVKFPQVYNSAYSIELLQAFLPAGTSEEQYAVIILGDPENMYTTIEGAQTFAADSDLTSVFYTPVFDDAFAVIPLERTVSVPSAGTVDGTVWKREDVRWIKRFKGPRPNIKGLTITIQTQDPTNLQQVLPFPVADEPLPGDTSPANNFMFVFEIVAQDG